MFLLNWVFWLIEGNFSIQVVDKSRYAAGDNSLEREIQVLIKVRRKGS